MGYARALCSQGISFFEKNERKRKSKGKEKYEYMSLTLIRRNNKK